MGLLKIHKIKTLGGLRNVYELGRHNGKPIKKGYDEDLYFDRYFKLKLAIHKLEKEKQDQVQIIERNTPKVFDDLNQQIEQLENELVKLNDRTLDSFR